MSIDTTKKRVRDCVSIRGDFVHEVQHDTLQTNQDFLSPDDRCRVKISLIVEHTLLDSTEKEWVHELRHGSRTSVLSTAQYVLTEFT